MLIITRKGSRIAMGIVAVACLGGFALLILGRGEPEPVYQGKPMSFWLEAVVKNPKEAEWDQAGRAVRQAGTNAIPTLLRLLRAKDSAVTVRLQGLINRLPFFRIGPFPAESRNHQAYIGFSLLRDAASNAVPAIIKICESRVSENSKNWALLSLELFPEQHAICVPVLIKALHDPSDEVRAFADKSLHQFGELAVPELKEALRDPDLTVSLDASNLLYLMGPAAPKPERVK